MRSAGRARRQGDAEALLQPPAERFGPAGARADCREGEAADFAERDTGCAGAAMGSWTSHPCIAVTKNKALFAVGHSEPAHVHRSQRPLLFGGVRGKSGRQAFPATLNLNLPHLRGDLLGSLDG